MELVTGLALINQQYRALLKKNFLLSWRNKSATLLQLLSSFFFIFLLFWIEKAMFAGKSDATCFKTVRDPVAVVAAPIPPCEEKFYIKTPCFDFVWSGNENPTLATLVGNIMANNPGRPIPSSKVKSFRTPDEVDAWLLNNPLYCPGAIHLRMITESQIAYGIQTNSTAVEYRGNYEDPTFKFQVPLQIAVEREVTRSFVKDPGLNWVVAFKEFAHPAEESASTMDNVGPVFFLAFSMLGFVMQLGSLVTEKELKLRQAMNITGLYDSVYWMSWITWEGLLSVISALFVVLFGMMFQLMLFKKNDFAVVFLVFFLFQLNMIAFAFMLSTFISKASAATTAGFSIFIIGFLTQLVSAFGFPYDTGDSLLMNRLWSSFPPNILAVAVKLLAKASATPEDIGIRWSRRAECVRNESCYLTINDAYRWLIVTFFVWFALAIYLDNIMPNISGVRKPILYFLNPGYWTGKGGGKLEEGGIFSFMGKIPQLEHITPDDEDVLQEENVVKGDAAEGRVDPNIAVQIRGLQKTYPGTTKVGCCCKCKKTQSYHAIRGLWVNFMKDQLFTMLGPNGAGKTTTISCLTGLTPVTGGDALIYGHSIRTSVGMSNIRRFIGVCPQFDILWDILSGREHLQLFASIKGLPASSINMEAEELLARVKLAEKAEIRSRSYSGGMKRRLSVAIALIGDPKLVILDEPTTGMDPISRRHVWDVIQSSKKGRAIVLTTHSMEEADILSDRIGIMAKGRLRCVGTSIRLKSKFGTGFITNVSFVETDERHSSAMSTADYAANQLPLKQYFKQHLDVVPSEETRSFVTFIIPHNKEKLLTKFFSDLEEKKGEFGIADVQLGLTTLEEVFLNIARKAELETATAEGRTMTLSLTSGEQVEIPIGAQFVGIPGTECAEYPLGIMVEVYWDRDAYGALCISGHSENMPVPSHARSLMSAEPPSTLGRREGPVYGIVIDPSQITSADTWE